MKIKELLANPKNWTKGQYCKRKDGGPVVTSLSYFPEETSPETHCYCLHGAVYFCYPEINERSKVQTELLFNLGRISAWNDAPERTHAEVLELVTRLDV
jgi:hypothetical protein